MRAKKLASSDGTGTEKSSGSQDTKGLTEALEEFNNEDDDDDDHVPDMVGHSVQDDDLKAPFDEKTDFKLGTTDSIPQKNDADSS